MVDYEDSWNCFRKSKAVMIAVIPQQEAPWVLFGFCTYRYLLVQPLPNISTAPSCFLSPGTGLEQFLSPCSFDTWEIGCHGTEHVAVTAGIANMAQQPLRCPWRLQTLWQPILVLRSEDKMCTGNMSSKHIFESQTLCLWFYNHLQWFLFSNC